MTKRFVILGGGPAGNTAASVAAAHGAEVVLVEREIVGGAAHLRDCVPSKAMIATGNALRDLDRAAARGLRATGSIDDAALRARVADMQAQLTDDVTRLLDSQGVRTIRGSGRLVGPFRVAVDTAAGTEELDADAVLLATGSRARLPEWAPVDGERVLSTRDAYPPPEIPEHLVVVGSGVTGVEFTHMFAALGSRVTLVVSRQQVLPTKDAEVAAALEEEFARRGVELLKGARAAAITRTGDRVTVECEDGRTVVGSHALLCVGSVPNSDGLGCDAAGVEVSPSGHVPGNRHCQTNVPHIYSAGDLSGRLPLSSVATAQGRGVAEHVMGLTTVEHRHLEYDKAAQAVFTDPEIAEVGVAEAEAFAAGAKLRVTKVPFSANARALINGDSRGFAKLLSDPATGVVLGGVVVGRNASELISVVAVAVANRLRAVDLVDTLLVHPALTEAIAETAS
ncbi:MAG: FAD-dependent oxidoreductase [Actinomycetota bacterium]